MCYFENICFIFATCTYISVMSVLSVVTSGQAVQLINHLYLVYPDTIVLQMSLDLLLQW